MIEVNKYQSDDISELASALASAQGKITFALKDASTTAFSNCKTARKYATLQSILTAIKEPLSSNGLAFIQSTLPCNDGVAIRTVLMHKSGQWVSGVFVLPADRQGGIQGLGSSLTYARRYSLSALIGICADDDDDGEASVKALTSNPAPKKAPADDAENAEKKKIGEFLWQVALPTLYPEKDTAEYPKIVFNVSQNFDDAPKARPARLFGYELPLLKEVKHYFETVMDMQANEQRR